MFSETLSARLFKAENFPQSSFQEGDSQSSLLDWVDWEMEKVAGGLGALAAALSVKPKDKAASLQDSDLVGLLTLLEGRLKVAGAALKEAQRLDRAERIEL